LPGLDLTKLLGRPRQQDGSSALQWLTPAGAEAGVIRILAGSMVAESMRTIRYTLINHVSAPIDRVFRFLTDPARMSTWLPGCTGVETEGALTTVR
jgi:hypothetical protein